MDGGDLGDGGQAVVDDGVAGDVEERLRVYGALLVHGLSLYVLFE